MAFNVLIVDDSLAMRSVIKKTIKIAGFKIGELLEASDGRKALEVMENAWVDVVLTDINMPNMNGFELIETMQQDAVLKQIPIVMVTTEGSEKAVERAMTAGARGFIQKPFSPEEIVKTLNQILGEPTDEDRNTEAEDGGLDF